MDWAYRAVLTATVVGVVMMAARLFGRRTAGRMAGLPVTSAPALLWLAQREGADFAAASAVGSLAACAAAPLFAWGFERVARRHGPVPALLAGLSMLALALLAVHGLHQRPAATLVLALLACALVQATVSRQPVTPGWVRPLRGELALSAAVAGMVVAVVTLGAQRLGPFWSGVAAALPVISACALVHLRMAGGAGEVTAFVSGYVPGVAAKALFLFAFACLVMPWGVAGALLAAVLAGAAGAGVLSRLTASAGGASAGIHPVR